MRPTIFLLIALSTVPMQAQEAARESLRQEIDRHGRAVYAAAERFLNRRLPAGERIEAIEPYLVLYDEKQIEGFKSVAADREEEAVVRAAALDRLVQTLPLDPRLRQLVLAWLGDPSTPRPLREAALRAEANVSFTESSVPEVYQKLLDDPELPVRQFAFTKLIIHGDARAQQRLIEGLENPAAAALPAPTAIAILTLAQKKEYLPAVYKVLLQTTDEPTRLEAIRAVGGYAEATNKLIAITRDPKEKEPFREAALGALYSGDRDRIVEYVAPLLASGNASPRLQAIGLQMTADVRQAMPYRFKAKRADSYDRMVERLTREATDPELREVARRYVEAVRPRY